VSVTEAPEDVQSTKDDDEIVDFDLALDIIADLVGSSSRILAGLSALKPYKQTGLGLTEWTLLMLISRSQSTSSAQIRRSLGLARDSIDQITRTLAMARFITVTASPEDPKLKEYRITDEGQAELSRLNKELDVALLEPMKGHGREIVKAIRSLKRIARVVPQREGRNTKAAQSEAGTESKEV
jgi:DNA-binding MarR family transcriptional regulator